MEPLEKPWRSTPASAASGHGQGAQQLPPNLGPGTAGVATDNLAIPATMLMATVRSAKVCSPDKIFSALSLHSQTGKKQTNQY